MSQALDLRGQNILIAGSASLECPAEKLRLAHAFVRAVVEEILAAGGNLVVLASGEPRQAGDEQLPLVFDWTALEVLEQYAAASPGRPSDGPRAWVVTSNKALKQKLSDAHREVLSRLTERELIELMFIPDEVYTGGNIVEGEVQRATAMVALGGGKGVADRASKMQRKKAPVLPLDLELGAFSADGEGAVGLHRQAREEPGRFFPCAHEHFKKQVLALSLNGAGANPQRVAKRVVGLLGAEFEAAKASAPADVALLTALPVELEAVKRALGMATAEHPRKLQPTGTNYWSTTLDSRRSGRPFRVITSCIGRAGTNGAAASATELIMHCRPRLIIMVGIAAGMRGKCRLGEVLISQEVIGYESAAVVTVDGRREYQYRPDSYRIGHSTQQDVAAYLSAGVELGTRLDAALERMGMRLPEPGAEDVASGLSARLATLASGSKLLREPTFLSELREDIHGKIEAGDMEAAGIAEACHREGVPFLVVRGISDFGDARKDDHFHRLAATGAAIVSVDFIREALWL